ncbi:MAG: YgcG family protein [Lautropia sp.]
MPACLPAARVLAACLLLIVGAALVRSAHAQAPLAVPALTARVTDQTGMLSPAEKRSLEARLVELEQRKGAQVAILLVETTAPESIEAYSIRVAEAWKLGRGKVDGKAVDDGLLILVAVRDRRIRLEVGYGLEGALPDAIARRIIAESIAPPFRRGAYAEGLDAGLADIEARIAGEPLPPPWDPAAGARAGDRQQGGEAIGIVPLLLFAFVGATILSSIVGRLPGALAGGIGAGVLGLPLLGSALLAAGAGLIVFVAVMVVAPSARRVRRVGRRTYGDGPVILPGGWGGRGGGSWGGGGFGGGGFGGGGGGFGGGGASGGW